MDLAKGQSDTATDMLWVDELSCIGCTWCASVARQTFRMANGDHEFGTARVVQQGGDCEDTIQEAIDCCPADCIMHCTRNEVLCSIHHGGTS
jgi:ferredoxin